jgi:hypothetical protein
MPLNVRSTAVSFAVLCFFAVSFVGWAAGHQPFTCCKRAIAAALLAYLLATYALKAVNAILFSAIVSKQMNERREQAGDTSD